MTTISAIEPIDTRSLHKEYDAFVATVGYESRAIHAAKELNPKTKKRIAFAFKEKRVLSFDDNLRWFKKENFDVSDADYRNVATGFRSLTHGLMQQSDSSTILIDISSMTRLWIAVIVDAMCRVTTGKTIVIDFIYALAEFNPPPLVYAPYDQAGPVLPSFAGWTSDPERPPSVIVGLGYEANRALGAVENIQANDVWTFIPSSSNQAYDHPLLEANRILLDEIPESRRLGYRVERPFDCFVKLETLANSCLQAGSTVILPFGPKIFALCSLLVALIHQEVSIWRVSAGRNEDAIDRKANGVLCGLRVTFGQTAIVRQNV